MTVTPEILPISTYFDIKQTSYGGRAVFANKEICKDTKVLVCDHPLSSFISYPFRKEVCCYCFHYNNGKTLKFKIPEAELWFCSQNCLMSFNNIQFVDILIDSFSKLSQRFQQCKKRLNSSNFDEQQLNLSDKTDDEIQDFIEANWKNINNIWIPSVSNHDTNSGTNIIHVKNKANKVNNQQQKNLSKCPLINEEEFTESRFITQLLFHMQICNENLHREVFTNLQSNELEMIKRFPPLLFSQIKIFQNLYIILPTELQKFLNTATFRQILGSEYANAFGIWELSDADQDSRELFGSGLYAEASFFNNSCQPNLVKTRNGHQMFFKVIKDIEAGEELCINYGNNTAMDISERQKYLFENWFFHCACTKCKTECLKL
ncbi:Set6p SCDLUD_002176 [Saccharomycodes ludwigii]|uniref:Set6p n=1 Tax=Saccharomycodes ludwigii TaxID=36035 RepID=UPI001E8B1B29|nr:hypothetical protein SCDLUD_002176 [Saccharomycodes ludwigii]KAH3902356.1 hypothetical protein SCDLUD_002176 [Saccharomycodes ludwigii]